MTNYIFLHFSIFIFNSILELSFPSWFHLYLWYISPGNRHLYTHKSEDQENLYYQLLFPPLSEIRKPTAESHCVLAFFQIKKKSYVFIFAYNICTSWWFILSKYLLIPNQKKLILLKIKKTAWQFSYIPSSLLIAKSHHLNDQNSP